MDLRFLHSLFRTTTSGGKPLRAKSSCSAIAILALAGGIGLAMGTAHAEPGETHTAAANAREAAEPPARLSPSEKRALRLQKKTQWWNHARVVLLSNLVLSDEQRREVDAIIDEQLSARADFLAGDAKLKVISQRGKREVIDPIRAELREIRARLREPHEIFEDMRALLREEQRPTFDRNRARLVAEGQAPREGIPVSSRRSPSS